MINWWEAPSNLEFLSQIVDQSWKGNIVLVYLPEHVPAGFIAALKRKLNASDVKNIEKIPLTNCDLQKPYNIENLIHEYFSLDSDGKYISRNIKDIFNKLQEENIGAFIFEKIPPELQKDFNTFIDGLRRYLLGLSPLERPKIICIINPKHFNYESIPSEAGLSKLLFQQVFDKLDLLIGIKLYLDKKDLECFELNNLVISYLSVFDYNLIEELSELPNFFFGDISFLADYSDKKDWKSFSYIPIDKLKDNEIWNRWAHGILERKNEKLIYHPAFLKAKGKVEEINKRIWNAELEILLPMIENYRFLIVENKKVIFPDQFTNKITGLVKNDKYEFEIGEISFLLDTFKITLVHFSSLEKDEVRNFVRLCKEIRNCLSHMRNINIEDLKSFISNYNRMSIIMS